MDWKAIMTPVIVAAITAIVVSMPMQLLAALVLQPWTARRIKRLQDEDAKQAPVRCPACNVKAPGWFMKPQDEPYAKHEILCFFCLVEVYRRPRPDERPRGYWKEQKQAAKRAADAVKKPREYAKVILVEEPPTKPDDKAPPPRDDAD